MKPEKQLYQWDINQYLTGINPAAQYVDYAIGKGVIRMGTEGTRCRIPDELLQTDDEKTCYERYPDGTFRAYSFTVLYAPKPPDYVYTPEERTTFETLTARVDAAIEDIKRRADSGEFTPVKGVDYFTEAEKNELMEIVSSGAVGEFRKVVDTATTEYNDNASEKLTTYDTNAEQHTTDYNSNAEVKLEAYNQNHAAKVSEYNQNAETKTAEFDANAAALQTEVDRLRGECDQLATENRKQENRIDALMKLNKGQTYDIVPEEGEAASRTAPSGSKYVSVDKAGGKSVAWNQLVNGAGHADNVTYADGRFTISNLSDVGTVVLNDRINLIKGHKYFIEASSELNNCIFYIYTHDYKIAFVNIGGINKDSFSVSLISECSNTDTYRMYLNRYGATEDTPATNYDGYFQLFDLTAMFGTTIADYIYSIEQSQAGAGVALFKKLFPADYYPYSEPTIISSQTDRVDVASSDGTITQQITTGFPVLNSAGSVYDYIDLNEGKLHQRVGVVDLGTLNWVYLTSGSLFAPYMYADVTNLGIKYLGTFSKTVHNIVCPKYTTVARNPITFVDKTICADGDANNVLQIQIKDSAYTDATSFKQAMNGVMLYYELAEPVITDIEIPTELTDWLTVEAGGTVAFRNADESKQLPVPNAVSWVRKLNEVE